MESNKSFKCRVLVAEDDPLVLAKPRQLSCGALGFPFDG